ncbi:MAG TPA: lactate dehydrogenase [Clostridiales bacterium]|nr:lactate dehydrogenase [Clostridiales bacterium]
MFYYKYNDKYLFSIKDEYNFTKINSIPHDCQELYYLNNLTGNSKRTFSVNHPSDLYINEESPDMLRVNDISYDLPDNITELIDKRKIKAVNTTYNDYADCFYMDEFKKRKVNILALGDVGSTLLIGLKLLGKDSISSIGIYDRSLDKIKRWEYEMNQTSFPFDDSLPMVQGIKKEELFDCDMFIFCASKGVPPVGSQVADVRMAQFEGNAELIKEYALMAADCRFKGIFAVVSDPVDQLCQTVLRESRGVLAPEQIKGYGLGVMNARALYYSKKFNKFSMYLKEGRAFGPHGKDLIIANSITNYDDELSRELTKYAVEANLEVRKTGFKPYIAPALSSGAISIIYTLEGKYHYSSNYLAEVYMGAKNRNLPSGLDIEKIRMPDKLFERIKETYERLK